ncbi:PPPDE putative peptidase domain-containing protein [Emericellopsis atlantica]|uniref:PPPDE putative peptidase domain-containing protein n=1 Tax=Emericellopsis atlantica TaxID=2614577 RepID=A0A9P7ZIL2_9HYPO|nr:PPPDE putative peptidase domain-containing protein [Emericellopsis atlantica]KAG9252759.1 PPPDE putative peptidase domain-containing protein [Emericellopsis atlantica]
MDVHLLVYDLSGGLARQMSLGILGFQLDAIYHTSIELGGREYVYDGGILAIAPGSSHLGQPLERLLLGKTSLTFDIIDEYLDSVRSIFTVEAYDLFRHNCNNFTDSFANFLLGKGIPSHISSMPQAVLESPMGRMLLAALTQGVNNGRQNGSIMGIQQQPHPKPQNTTSTVISVADSSELTHMLENASASCAVIFFTSRACAPCETLDPTYTQLARDFGSQSVFLKVDIERMPDVASQFSVKATPAFVTFLRGQRHGDWTGGSPANLQQKIELLCQMAATEHPHLRLKIPSFSSLVSAPITYAKIPPLSKSLTRLGDGIAARQVVRDLIKYLEVRESKEIQDAVLPSLHDLSIFVRGALEEVPVDARFVVVDLLRCAVTDPRISGYFAEEKSYKCIMRILALVDDGPGYPYALRLVTLQMACNMFTSPLFARELLAGGNLLRATIKLILTSFLDESHNSSRVAAASLLFNVVVEDRRSKRESPTSGLSDSDQVELAAALLEAIGQEQGSADALRGMLLALGHLFVEADLDGELADLLRVLDAQHTVLQKKAVFPREPLVDDVGGELLGRGLSKP